MRPAPVSVIIPTYNRSRLVRRTVENILPQLTVEDEVFVVDDGSTDDTETVIAAMGPPVRYLRVPHGGAGAARNAGIRAATKPLVAFLDSDDLWFPDKLTLQRAVLDHFQQALFCFSNFGVRHADGSEARFYMERWHDRPLVWEDVLGPGVPFSSFGTLPSGRADFRVHVGDLFAAELEQDYVLPTTLVARREAGDALRFAEDTPTWEDWECIGRLSKRGLGAYLDCETAWQCAHEGVRRSFIDGYRRSGAALTIMKRIWGDDPAFLGKHGELYERVRRSHHLTRAKYLIRHGRTSEARAEMAEAVAAPLTWKMLSWIPGPALRGLFEFRSRMCRRG